jgi:hypothetical protein
VPDPDTLPDYPYQRLPMASYLRETFLGRRTLSHHSSYGCPFSCSFCAVANLTRGRWLAQSGEHLARVVTNLVERFSADAVEFFDNCFFVDEQRVADFAARITPLGLGWWGEARVDTLARYSIRTWELLRDSGLRMVFMGAESGSDETLELMNKGGQVTTDATLAIAEQMQRYGIVPEFSFVLGNPPDPESDVRRTLTFIRRLKAINPRAEIILYMYTPVPNRSALFGEATRSGFDFPDTLEEWVAADWADFSARREIRVPWLSRSLRREVRDFECVLNAYYPTATNPRLGGWRRWVLRSLSAGRYHTRCYRHPVELQLLQRLMAYRRPETSGF